MSAFGGDQCQLCSVLFSVLALLSCAVWGSAGPDIGQAGKDAADKAASKAKNAAPDLLEGIFDRAQKSIGKISNEVWLC